MGKKKNKKKGDENRKLQKMVLITASINLLAALIDLVDRLLE